MRPPSVTTVTPPRPASSRPRHVRALEDLDAALLARRARARPRAWPGARMPQCVLLPHGGEIGGRGDGCLRLGLVEIARRRRSARGIGPLVEPLDLVGLGRRRRAGRCARSRSRCRSAPRTPRSRRGSRARARSSDRISSGQRRRPFSRPCVRLASQKPPLRPDAAQPTRCASTTTTFAAGVALAWRAARSTGRCSRRRRSTRSARCVPTQRGPVGRRPAGRSSSQNTRVRVCRRGSDG